MMRWPRGGALQGAPFKHSWLRILAVVGIIVFQIILMGVTFWAMEDYDITEEWYNTKQPTGAYFDILYGPPKWVIKSMWPILFIYQLVWQMYAMCHIFRKTPDKTNHLYLEVHMFPMPLFVAYLISMMLRMAWAAMLPTCGPICSGMIAGSFVASTCATIIAWMALQKDGAKMYDMCLSLDIYLVRGLLHNGLAAWTTWELIEFLVSLRGVIHQDGLSHRDAATTTLGLGGIFLITYGVLDLFLFDAYTRYTLSPYVILFLALIGMVSEHWYSGSVSFVALLLLLMVIIIAVMKVLNIFSKRKGEREPIKCHKRGSKVGFNQPFPVMQQQQPQPQPMMVQQQIPFEMPASSLFPEPAPVMLSAGPEPSTVFVQRPESVMGYCPTEAPQMVAARPPSPTFVDYSVPASSTMPGPSAQTQLRFNQRIPSMTGLEGLPIAGMEGLPMAGMEGLPMAGMEVLPTHSMAGMEVLPNNSMAGMEVLPNNSMAGMDVLPTVDLLPPDQSMTYM